NNTNSNKRFDYSFNHLHIITPFYFILSSLYYFHYIKISLFSQLPSFSTGGRNTLRHPTTGQRPAISDHRPAESGQGNRTGSGPKEPGPNREPGTRNPEPGGYRGYP